MGMDPPAIAGPDFANRAIRRIMKIKDMKNGEYGFAIPWSMWRDINGQFWLIGDTNLRKNRKGTEEMQVFKYKGKYYIDTSACNEIWNKRENSGRRGDLDPIPVYQITHGGLSQNQKSFQ